MTKDPRDEVADALRARQSLENDVFPGDEDFNAENLSSGLRTAATDDDFETDDALDDDDVEDSDDD
jgi:hypothetical protein